MQPTKQQTISTTRQQRVEPRSGMNLGATYLGDGRCRFRVWAPNVDKIELRLLTPPERCFTMEALDAPGYYQVEVDDVEPGSLYVYRLNDDKERPDPASRFQPDGVHGPSQVIDPSSFGWTDAHWFGVPLQRYVIYELHVGTFSPQGTFEGVIPHLPALRDLGITAVELMPVAQFPGTRNWGYDGVLPFAVQNSYGGPVELQRLIDACHAHGLAVILDVVYNHLGAEGNYLLDYGQYFTDRYKTGWGSAVNFDGPHSDDVRRYFIENALYWLTQFHVDALRLDAIHAMLDFSAGTFLEELSTAVDRQAAYVDRRVYLIAESDLNDARVVRPRSAGGFGLDAQWNDDFHHAVHTLLTGESTGYYQDFVASDGGTLQFLAKALSEGYVYTGQYSRYRQRRHGNSSHAVPGDRLVVATQNHDQVGNRMLGERLSQLVSFDRLKLAAGLLLLSPFVPLIFMGEEYGEEAPFLYFISHGDPQLVEAVRSGRKQEFASFAWQGEPPDPASDATFLRSKLNHDLATQGKHAVLRNLYAELIHMRRELAPLGLLSKDHIEVHTDEARHLLYFRRWNAEDSPDLQEQVLSVFNFAETPVTAHLTAPVGRWRRLLDSSGERWQDPAQAEGNRGGLRRIFGSAPAGERAESVETQSDRGFEVALNPLSFAVYARERGPLKERDAS